MENKLKLKMNDVTYNQACKHGTVIEKVWLIHNLPEMGDCRSLDYEYEFEDDLILCDGIDITSNVKDYDYYELKYKRLKLELSQKNKLIEVQDKYIKLLETQCEELVGLHVAHGWMGDMEKYHQGKKCRDSISKLKQSTKQEEEKHEKQNINNN